MDYITIIKKVREIKEYCEKTGMWLSGIEKPENYTNLGYTKEEAEQLATTSKSLYNWLCKHNYFSENNHFDYENIEENGRPLKEILDELKKKIDDKAIIEKVKEIKEYCEKTGMWLYDKAKPENYTNLGYTKEEAEQLATTSKSLYRWLRKHNYFNKDKRFDYENVEENGISIKDILDELKKKIDDKAIIEKVKEIKEYCEKTGMWPSGNEKTENYTNLGYTKEEAEQLASTSKSLYYWLTAHKYFNENKPFDYENIEENGISIKDILDNLQRIYLTAPKITSKLSDTAQHYNLKKSSTSKNLLSKLYYLVVQFDLSYKSNDTEKYNSLYKEINYIISKNNLNIDINKINELITLDEDKKYELCLSEYMHSSIQNKLDNAELYKTLYNYYSVLRYGVNNFQTDVSKSF